MTGRHLDAFPLFPLSLVLLPQEIVPLHIFEDRYKTMVDECLSDEREFGIIWLADAGLREIGCSCRITEVLERNEDGQVDILVKGTTPFRLTERQEHLPYPAGTIELLDEDGHEAGAKAASDAREAYAALVERATDSRPDPTELDAMDAYGMAATVDFGPEAKQELLELRDEQSRLELVRSLFQAATKQLDHAELAQERARSNGKVHFQ